MFLKMIISKTTGEKYNYTPKCLIQTTMWIKSPSNCKLRHLTPFPQLIYITGSARVPAFEALLE